MMRTPRRTLLVAALLLAAVGPARAQRVVGASFGQPSPQPFAWWKSDQVKKELDLSPDQCARLDKIWETTRPELRQEWDELSRLEDKLSRLIQANADEAVLSRQIDRVETARANANKTRSMMFVQMRKTLTPEQCVRLDAFHERWVADQKKKQQQQQPQQPPSRDPRKRPEH
jgi:Spy/CpxP family protein refolding chaperone